MGNFFTDMIDTVKDGLGIKRPSEELIKDDLVPETTEDAAAETPKETEWIWIEGYKGMNKDMRCSDFQYEIGKRYDMPEDAMIEVCVSGFHFCRMLRSTFNYYALGGGNRFFKVRGLIKAEPYYHGDKFAAKSIEILEEVSREELLAPFGADEWEEKYQDLLFTVGYRSAYHVMCCDKLAAYGYSQPFADYLIKNGKLDIAEAVGSQPDLSMDTKVLMIMNSK